MTDEWLVDVCEALAGNLASIPDLKECAFVLSNVMLPAAEVQPGACRFDGAFGRGMDELDFTVRVLVGTATDVGSQKLLARLMAPAGTRSVKAAVETDRRLGGLVDDLVVTERTGPRVFAREGGSAALGAEWTVRVIAPGV